ncbi:Transcription factor iws1 [Yamadazyma tenuis]|uniref:Transcription factor IWS1 n=1 Tax=Candida tenuis (strain ATCC 10573 / BCRC 21748 / CBS 615 / JCM 9827 / NBRC 10315 / NRRL Y-1498 / VKM Y-70) TaxID=590646 RepID=G3B4T7_CANTC|nr:uncharacterized protein CANTEDRAFT_93373 [Yamadazyma tenuis ATCC 10573]EGV63869.1 hypothetical protein CANTEDRAFT_93373 [Yamadazyma tenuis ATCC 10573]WEJ96519.1 Transcription factor iws1 [Yamadazyma tenuis]
MSETEDINDMFKEEDVNDQFPDIDPDLNSDGNEDDQPIDNDKEVVSSNENDIGEYDEDVYTIQAHRNTEGATKQTKKKNIRRSKVTRTSEPVGAPAPVADYGDDNEQPTDEFANEDPASRKRRLLEEKMTAAIKKTATKRRKADEDDLERMQDDKIDYLKDKMIKAANSDAEKNLQGSVATEKLKMLGEVINVLSKADLAISILDNNLLEAVRLWLEPLPDSSMPAYQIQKELITALVDLPIKTDHLVASGMGKVMVFYQRSKRTEANLKRIVDKLIGDWTRPILNKSDSYKDRSIQFQEYNKTKFSNKLSSSKPKTQEAKTLYEESAERRNRAAIPAARTTAYKIAPKVNPEVLQRKFNGGGNSDERFKRINQKLNLKKKINKKSGPSIEGRNLGI